MTARTSTMAEPQEAAYRITERALNRVAWFLMFWLVIGPGAVPILIWAHREGVPLTSPKVVALAVVTSLPFPILFGTLHSCGRDPDDERPRDNDSAEATDHG
jgi:hypothetical protein